MAHEHPGDHQMLQNLAHVLYEQRKQEQQRPPITDQDILRAMLGKPWDQRKADTTPTRKAG